MSAGIIEEVCEQIRGSVACETFELCTGKLVTVSIQSTVQSSK